MLVVATGQKARNRKTLSAIRVRTKCKYVSCYAFLAWQREKSPSSLLPEARGTVDGITRGKKSKETGVDAGRSRE
ncbi:hypothetical protein FBG28_21445, partial [Salmonella enterica subsp. enterica serovar Reading]|nr:hypothetical protein [Salmonella enterica subsp. enterica serovar Reading]